MKPLIFLDVDGVMIPYSHYAKEYDAGRPSRSYSIKIPGYTLANLKKIIDNTGADIILSSSWRKDKDAKTDSCYANLCNQLKELDLHITDCTPDSSGVCGKEIKEFLEQYYNTKDICKIPYIIIDDEICDIDRYHAEHHIVQPKYGDGLSDRYADDAILKLSKIMKGIKSDGKESL